MGHYGAIGLQMGLSVAIGLVIGLALDRYLGTAPWMALIFLILGVIAGFRALFQLLKEIQVKQDFRDEGKK
ncbi:MAG: F0F1 ATP synthase assembly protein I [Proteobacteria bacterium]|nr:F0F1 ATP synthase assembly protein I [Pseudomonadota bacterium]NIS71765.1 F0F1 ATP synthase assembly protein I [Pseudomonadota bacterium]